MVPGEPDQIVVAGDDPQIVQFVPVDRVFLPEMAKVGVGIVGHFTGKQVVAHSRNHMSSPSEKSFAGCYGTSTARVTGVCRWCHSARANASFTSSSLNLWDTSVWKGSL